MTSLSSLSSNSAGAVAPPLENEHLADYAAYIARDIQNLREQQESLTQQLDDLVSQVIEPLESTAATHLPPVCEKLEATFQKIDALNAYLDRVNADIVAVNTTVRGILDAPSVSEKAKSFFSKFSFGGNDTKDEKLKKVMESGVWKRIPEHLMIGGSTSQDFLEHFHQSVSSATNTAAQLKKQ